MTQASLDHWHLEFLGIAAADMAAWGHNHRRAMAGPHGFQMVANRLRKGPEPLVGSQVWGWKEPNSHVVLPELLATFPDLRYVHVVRDPLDMAFSANTTQLRLWGPLHGVEVPREPDQIPNAQLAWWLESTRRVLDMAKQMESRFLLIRFESFCAAPEEHIRHLAQLAELEVTDDELARAGAHVVMPTSAGRWRSHGNENLDRRLLAEVAALASTAGERWLLGSPSTGR